MNIVAITGGLGNQMFQFAFGLALESYGYPVKFDISKYEYYQVHNNYELDNIFDIDRDYATVAERKKLGYLKFNRITDYLLRSPFGKKTVFCEPSDGFTDKVFSMDNTYFKGFWQNEAYFEPVSDKIRDVFRFPSPDRQELKEIIEKISSTKSVSIHIRRGDYLKHPLYSGLCGLDYYQNAYRYLTEKVGKDIHLFVFSNDTQWVTENLKFPNMTFVDCNQGKDSYRDMHLMSMCQHHIVANSSFSWWGAWLNPNPDKVVIAPERWVNSDKPLYREVVPKGWIKL